VSTARGPIFVVGHGRSGTTLLASTLNAHPDLAGGPETAFFDLLVRNRWRRLVRDPAWPDRAVDFLTSMEREEGGSVLAAYGLDAAVVRGELEAREPSIAAMLEAITVPYTRAQGKRRWVEKTPRHLVQVATIRRHWPDAAIVRIVRDPRAVAASFMAVPFGPSSVVGAAYQWRLSDDPTWRFFERDPGSATVRYEDLVREPERELRGLCDFLGEGFDARMLAPGAAGAAVAGEEPWKARVTAPIDATRVDAWRREITAADVSRVAVICADGLARYGYEGADAPRRIIAVHPMDASFLDDAEAVLTVAADRGVVFVAADPRWRTGPGRLVLWGSPGELRWSRGGRIASARTVARAARRMVGARRQGTPVLWVAQRVARRQVRSAAERAGDLLSRVLARRVSAEELLEELELPSDGV